MRRLVGIAFMTSVAGVARADAPTTVDKGDGYLLVTAKLKSKRELSFFVGGEGYAWVEVHDGLAVVVDSMGFDDMKWSYVERALV